MLLVGQNWHVEVQWLLDGVSVASGTAVVQFRRWNGTTAEYLQADLSTFDPASHDFSLAESGGGVVLRSNRTRFDVWL